MEIENLSIPHSGIYRRGVSPSKFPQAFLPTVPNFQRKMSSMKDNYLMAIKKSDRYSRSRIYKSLECYFFIFNYYSLSW